MIASASILARASSRNAVPLYLWVTSVHAGEIE